MGALSVASNYQELVGAGLRPKRTNMNTCGLSTFAAKDSNKCELQFDITDPFGRVASEIVFPCQLGDQYGRGCHSWSFQGTSIDKGEQSEAPLSCRAQPLGQQLGKILVSLTKSGNLSLPCTGHAIHNSSCIPSTSCRNGSIGQVGDKGSQLRRPLLAASIPPVVAAD
jgi:hypothetical protein